MADKFVASFNRLVDLRTFYSRGPAILPQQFYTLLYRPPFIEGRLRPEVKNFRVFHDEAKDLQYFFEELARLAQYNNQYLRYARFSADIARLLTEKDFLKVELTQQYSLRRKKDINPSRQDDEIYIQKLERFRDNSQRLAEEYEELWLLCAKRPNLDFPLAKFRNLALFVEQNLNQIRNGEPLLNPMLPSAYIWTNERVSLPKVRYFRKSFEIDGEIISAKIQVIAGNIADLFVNGQHNGEILSRLSLSIIPLSESIRVFDITKQLVRGKNQIGLETNHYLQSLGSLNVYLEYSIRTVDGNVKKNEIRTDHTWSFSYGPFEDTKWATPDTVNPRKIIETRNMKKALWHPIKIIGFPPALNSYLFKPNLLNGERSFSEDTFGTQASLYYMLYLLAGKAVAKFARLFSPFLGKIL